MRNISDAEWPILAVLWKKSPLPATEILSVISNDRFSTNLGTLRTHLRRLVEKGLISQSKQGKRQNYTPLIKKSTAIEYAVDKLLQNLPQDSHHSAAKLLLDRLNSRGIETEELRKIV